MTRSRLVPLDGVIGRLLVELGYDPAEEWRKAMATPCSVCGRLPAVGDYMDCSQDGGRGWRHHPPCEP